MQLHMHRRSQLGIISKPSCAGQTAVVGEAPGGRGGGGVLCEGGVGVALVMNEPTPMLPGMIPYWPFCAEVAPLRVTHSCLSTFSPLLGSYKPQQQSYVVTPLLLLRSTHFGVCSQHTKLWALSCALLLCIMHKPKLPTQTTTNGMVSHDILVAV